jgi:hypothetical protein
MRIVFDFYSEVYREHRENEFAKANSYKNLPKKGNWKLLIEFNKRH